MIKLQRIIGYEKVDNAITGCLLGLFAIGLCYYLQLKHYAIIEIWQHYSIFTIPLLKRSLLAGIPVFFLFNHFDKLYAVRGVLFAIIIVGLILIKIMFFTST